MDSADDEIEEEELTFTSKEDLDAKIKNLNKRKANEIAESGDELSPQELQKLKNDEKKLLKRVAKATLDHGELSIERATALHALGGNMYKQKKYREALEMSKEIVRIHEQLDGFEHENTAKALGNLGSVSYKVGEKKELEYAMKRALYIYLKIHGEDSKPVSCLI